MVREWFDIEYLLIDDWLAVATKGLSEESATRVAEEIQEHYNESVAALIAEGYRPGGAELETIKRLGSPFRARRHYRHEYPTFRDMKEFDRYKTEIDSVRELGNRLHWREIFSIAVILFVAFVYFLEGASEAPWILFVSAYAATSNILAARVAVRASAGRGIRREYQAYLCTTLVLGWLMTVYFGLVYLPSAPPILFGLLVVLMFFLTLRTLRIWRKIRPMLSD